MVITVRGGRRIECNDIQFSDTEVMIDGYTDDAECIELGDIISITAE